MQPEALSGLEALGNVGVVPIIIFLTQLIKKKIGDFRYGSDVLALLLSFVLCIGWEFYYMSPVDYLSWSTLSGLGFFKWGVLISGTSLATWLASSKIYDLGHGNKKREGKVIEEKKVLEEKIITLQNGNGERHEESVGENEISSQLRKILEEEN